MVGFAIQRGQSGELKCSVNGKDWLSSFVDANDFRDVVTNSLSALAQSFKNAVDGVLAQSNNTVEVALQKLPGGPS